MIRYRVQHRTTYQYHLPVTHCHNEARLKPRITAIQNVCAHQLRIDPEPSVQDERFDFFGNSVHSFAVDLAHETLSAVAESEVEITPPMPWNPPMQLTWEQARLRIQEDSSPAGLEAQSYVLDSPLIPWDESAGVYVAKSFPPGRSLVEAVSDFVDRIFREFAFDPTATTVSTPVATVLKQRRGVCQDFAHLAIAGLRYMGLPARYVSGYIETIPPEGVEKLVGADASHAWASTFIPDLGWVDIDPTNNLFPVHGHIVLAWGRDFADVTPLKGVIIGGGNHHLEVAVDVERVDLPPVAVGGPVA